MCIHVHMYKTNNHFEIYKLLTSNNIYKTPNLTELINLEHIWKVIAHQTKLLHIKW